MYAMYSDKVDNLCKLEVCKSANLYIYVILLQELVNIFHSVSYL